MFSLAKEGELERKGRGGELPGDKFTTRPTASEERTGALSQGEK